MNVLCTRLAALLATFLLAGAADSASAQTELEPGTWKLHVASTTNGNPDPVRDSEDCLKGDQLKDLGAYFAPSLEGAQADCNSRRQPSSDPGRVDYRMQCTGDGFTIDATTTVKIESARRFTAALRIDSRSESEAALVLAEVEGIWGGACKAPPPADPTPSPGE
jgi:hypothetical protein